MALLTPIFDPKWALVGPKPSQNVSKYVSCCNQDSSEYEISWLVVLMAFLRSILEFLGTKILAQFTTYIFFYRTLRYPQYAKEITRKSIQPFL